MRTIATPWDARTILVQGPLPDNDWFTAEELQVAAGFRLAKRRNEWLLSRAAAKKIAVDRGWCHSPADCRVERPHFVIEGVRLPWYVSLSHAEDYAAVAIGLEPVGIDVEALRKLPEDAAHLFLSPEETAEMQRCSVAHRILHFWSAKEAAWKRALGAYATLGRVPLRLVEEREAGLLFDSVETAAIGDVIAAITLAS